MLKGESNNKDKRQKTKVKRQKSKDKSYKAKDDKWKDEINTSSLTPHDSYLIPESPTASPLSG